MKAEPLALTRWDDVLVDKGAAAPQSCRSPAERRPRTAASGLLPAGKASTAKRITYFRRVSGSTRPRRRILRGHKFNTLRTTAIIGG